jgi:dipeptidyl-peptidase-4
VADLRTEDFHWLNGKSSPGRATGLAPGLHLFSGRQIVRLITPGGVDVISIDGVDEKSGWLYYSASPENATQHYLYRARLDGSGKAERVTPLAQPGWHTYKISPDGAWAFHVSSKMSTPSTIDLVRLPGHSVARVLAET